MFKHGVAMEESCFCPVVAVLCVHGDTICRPGTSSNSKLAATYRLWAAWPTTIAYFYADLVCALCWSWSQLLKYSRNHGVSVWLCVEYEEQEGECAIRYVHTLGWLVWFQCWATCTASSHAL